MISTFILHLHLQADGLDEGLCREAWAASAAALQVAVCDNPEAAAAAAARDAAPLLVKLIDSVCPLHHDAALTRTDRHLSRC